MADQTIKEMLQMIDAKINHIEDITADNRAIIIKLVKQGNDIVNFLKQIDIESDEQMAYEDASFDINVQNTYPTEKVKELKSLLNEFMDRREDLKEFEEELKKHKGNITPGQIGDA
tara:strand:+ start:563 stop:910 length:348 start_codon:yes stop_codon:yes gene_type:complete